MSKKKDNKYVGIGTLEILEGAENYNKWISQQVSKEIVSPIMEFGAGTGNITKNLLNFTPFFITEKDPALLRRLGTNFKEKKGIYISELDVSKEPPKKFISYFSTIFGVNVLEHIENDKEALIKLRKTLKKNGKIVLLVPANKKSYSRLDKKLGHFRRYEKNELTRLLTDAGYSVESVYYFNFLGLLAWKTRDLVEQNVELKPTQVRLFDFIVPVLKIIESIVKPPIGVSLIVVARK